MRPGTDNDELEGLEEKELEYANAEIFEHPTRDDWHEQREPEQECEAVLHTCVTILEIRLSSHPTGNMHRRP
jgi:hypothetical protein